MTIRNGNASHRANGLCHERRSHADNYLTHARGIASWLFTLDHKRIGVMYLVSVLAAFLLGGIVAMLIRTQLLKPEGLLIHGNVAMEKPPTAAGSRRLRTFRSTRPTTSSSRCTAW